MKKIVAFMLLLMMIVALAAACSSQDTSGEGESEPQANEKQTQEEPVTIKLAMWDSNNAFIDYLKEKVKEYSSVKSNVTVEVESFKSDGDYLQTMKVRLSADELPDIIQLKPNFINDFKDELLPLNDMSFTERNKFAEKYAVDGQVLAIPNTSFPELVYYHPSIFDELNLEVPTTWPEFIDVLQQIQADGKYIPYAMGGKDSWPNYPFNEFMPLLESGRETYLRDIAKEDHPFAEGTPFYESYSKIDKLYKANVMGPDPLGVGWDQATQLFESKQAAVVAAGLWYLASYENNVGTLDDLAAFPLPYRDSEEEPLKVMTFTDHFYGVNKHSKHLEEVKAFLEWFYTPEVYQTYINKIQLSSTFEDVESDVPFLNDFYSRHPVEPFTYLPGDEQYTQIANAIQLDWKKLGQNMMAGQELSEIAEDLNQKWEKARQSIE